MGKRKKIYQEKASLMDYVFMLFFNITLFVLIPFNTLICVLLVIRFDLFLILKHTIKQWIN